MKPTTSKPGSTLTKLRALDRIARGRGRTLGIYITAELRAKLDRAEWLAASVGQPLPRAVWSRLAAAALDEAATALINEHDSIS